MYACIYAYMYVVDWVRCYIRITELINYCSCTNRPVQVEICRDCILVTLPVGRKPV